MSPDAVVVGGGMVGLATAWRAAEAGLAITVVDPRPGSGASHVAAGMLAPVTEVTYGEQALLRLAIASARRWPDFAGDLEAAADQHVGYRALGTLLVGLDADDQRVLDDLHRFQEGLGLDVERLRSRDCRSREPMLSPRVRGGILARDDHQVDPRRVVAALLTAVEAAGVEQRPGRVAEIEHHGDRVAGVRLETGERLRAPRVVVSAGCWSGELGGLPSGTAPVRPVKGEILRLRSRDGDPVLSAAVRGLVRGRSVYLVPRGDGRVVVGATQQEAGFDTSVTAGGVRTLLDDAASIVPGVDELELCEATAGLRPGTPDNAPLIGQTEVDGLVLATGHHRNGVLLTPVTAEAAVAALTGAVGDPVLAVADPRRDSTRQYGFPPSRKVPGR